MPCRRPPRTSAAAPIGGAGTAAPGQEATVRATTSTASTPQPIGAKASQSRPSGISTTAAMPAGMISAEVIGTAAAFATTP